MVATCLLWQLLLAQAQEEDEEWALATTAKKEIEQELQRHDNNDTKLRLENLSLPGEIY